MIKARPWAACLGVLYLLSASSSMPAETPVLDNRIVLLRSASVAGGSGPRYVSIAGDAKARISDPRTGEVVIASVTVIERSYECLVVETDGAVVGRSRNRGFIHYELRAADSLFSWNIWSRSPLGHFRTFLQKDGATLLVWVEGRDLYYIELQQANDPLEALSRVLSGGTLEDAVRIQVVGTLIDRGQLRDAGGRNAFFLNIDVVSMGKDDRGRMVVRIAGREDGNFHTLVHEGDRWRLQ
mgnify:CR=1 FL=1